jgi:hypothetical protein
MGQKASVPEPTAKFQVIGAGLPRTSTASLNPTEWPRLPWRYSGPALTRVRNQVMDPNPIPHTDQEPERQSVRTARLEGALRWLRRHDGHARPNVR